MNTMIVILILLIIVYILIKYFKKSFKEGLTGSNSDYENLAPVPDSLVTSDMRDNLAAKMTASSSPTITEGFSLGTTSSEYDYLAPVPSDIVTDDSWEKLAEKYNTTQNVTTNTAESMKTILRDYLTTDEINSFIDNGIYPYDSYVTQSASDLVKSTYQGSDFDADFSKMLEQWQKMFPNRYFYKLGLSQADAAKSPQPDAYLIYTGQKPPPSQNEISSVSGPGAYAFQLLNQLFQLCIYFFIGTAVLYSVKVAQTNLMPTVKDCEPFQYVKRADYIAPLVNVDVVKMNFFGGDLNMFLSKLEDNAVKSTKIRFPYEDNVKTVTDGFLGFGYIKKTVSDEHCSNIMNYIMSVHKGMVLNMAGNINAVGNFFNSTFSESVIVFLGSGVYGFIVFLLLIVNIFYGWVYYFVNMVYLFSKKEVVKVEYMEDGQKQFKNMANWDDNNASINWFTFPLYLIVAFLFWGFAWAVVIPIMAIVTTIKLLFLPLYFVGKVDGTKEKYTFGTMLKNTLLYKKSVLMYIISFYIVSGASNLGMSGLIFSIIGCLFVYVFFPDVYNKYIPNDTNTQCTFGLASYTMAKKTCLDYFEKNTIPKGTMEQLLDPITEFFEPKSNDAKDAPVFIDDATVRAPAPTTDVEAEEPRPVDVKPLEGGKRRRRKL